MVGGVLVRVRRSDALGRSSAIHKPETHEFLEGIGNVSHELLFVRSPSPIQRWVWRIGTAEASASAQMCWTSASRIPSNGSPSAAAFATASRCVSSWRRGIPLPPTVMPPHSATNPVPDGDTAASFVRRPLGCPACECASPCTRSSKTRSRPCRPSGSDRRLSFLFGYKNRTPARVTPPSSARRRASGRFRSHFSKASRSYPRRHACNSLPVPLNGVSRDLGLMGEAGCCHAAIVSWLVREFAPVFLTS